MTDPTRTDTPTGDTIDDELAVTLRKVDGTTVDVHPRVMDFWDAVAISARTNLWSDRIDAEIIAVDLSARLSAQPSGATVSRGDVKAVMVRHIKDWTGLYVESVEELVDNIMLELALTTPTETTDPAMEDV